MAGVFDGVLADYEKPISDIVRSNVARGYAPEIARAIAESFTLYAIGFYTLEGAAQAVRAAGLDDDAARHAAGVFKEAKASAA